MEKTKKVTVVGIVLKTLARYMIAINLIGIIIISFYAQQKMQSSESDYIQEIVSNISSSAGMKINEYITANEINSASANFITILETTGPANPLSESPLVSAVVSELQGVKSKLGSYVAYVGIVSASEQAFVTDAGDFSSPSDNVGAQPYYQAITTNKTVVTEPYFDSYSNQTLISIASPIHSSNNQVIGCSVFDFSVDFLNELTADFGLTGSTWMVDNSDNILSHSTTSLIGQSYTASGVSGTEFTRELLNPTGELITYDRGGTTRIGSVGYVSDLGWKLVAGIDKSEFMEDVYLIVAVIILIQVIIVILALVVSGQAVALRLRPLKELNECMEEMSKGNLSALPKYQSQTEIGQLCENLRVTMTNLGIYINEIRSNLNAFGSGDFTRKSELEFLGDFKAIQTSTDDFIELITSTLFEIKSSVDQVNGSSEFVASGSQNLAHGSIQQAESVNILNETVENIKISVDENVKNVEYVNERSHVASDGLAISNQKMDEMILAMQNIQKTSEAIENVVKTIEDVAFQTDILALNASVEAARAGQYGKGFAVVADEVRNLASRSSEAVTETSKLISESQEAVLNGSQIVSETAKTLVDAIEIVNGYMNTLDEVTNSSKGQAVAIAEINSRIADITSVMQNNTAISEESSAASEELSSQANLMKDSIEKFKLLDV